MQWKPTEVKVHKGQGKLPDIIFVTFINKGKAKRFVILKCIPDGHDIKVVTERVYNEHSLWTKAQNTKDAFYTNIAEAFTKILFYLDEANSNYPIDWPERN